MPLDAQRFNTLQVDTDFSLIQFKKCISSLSLFWLRFSIMYYVSIMFSIIISFFVQDEGMCLLKCRQAGISLSIPV